MKYAKYIIVAVIIVLVIMAIVFQDKIKGWFTKKPAAVQIDNAAGSGSGAGNGGAAALNYNKLLKFGSTGAEVRELQKWLGITADGIFGAQTEAALLARKGVEEITLSQFQIALDTNDNFAGSENDNDNADGDVLGWTDSNNSLIDGLQGWIFDWAS